MQRTEHSGPPTDLQETLRWLTPRHVGASFIQFIQMLPANEAEKVWLTVHEMERLDADAKRYLENAAKIYVYGWIVGIVGLLTIDMAFASQMPRGWLVPVEVAATALVGGLIYFFGRRITHKSYAASNRRFFLKEEVFGNLSVAYDEDERRVHSLARMAQTQARLTKGLDVCREVWEEMQQGAKLAREAGIDVSVLDRVYRRGNPVLTGALTIDNLLDEPEVGRVFSDMSKAGLKDYTLEAILLRRANEDGLPLTSRIIDQARARMQPSN